MALTERLALLVTGDMSHASRGFKGLAGDAAKLDKSVDKSGKGVQQLGIRGKVSGDMLKAGIATGAVVAGAAVLKFGKDSVGVASATVEQMSKVNVVFGDAAGDIKAFAEVSAKSMGISKRATLEAAGTFGNLLTSTGLTKTAAAGMSLQMTKLAVDMASFNDVPIEETLLAIRSGLAGETEPLKRFGVNLADVALKEKALSLGLIKTTTGVLPPAIKMQAAYSLILEKTKVQQGDAARTSGNLAGQQKRLTAAFEDLQGKMGAALIPAATGATKALSGLLDVATGVGHAIGEIPDPVADAGLKFAEFAAGAFLARKALGALGGVAKSGISKGLDKLAVDFSGMSLAGGGATKTTGLLRSSLKGLAGSIDPVTAGIVGLSAVFAVSQARAAAYRAEIKGIAQGLLAGGDVAAKAQQKLEGLQREYTALQAAAIRSGAATKEGSAGFNQTGNAAAAAGRKLADIAREMDKLKNEAGGTAKAQDELSAAQRTYADLLAGGTASTTQLATAEGALGAASSKLKGITDQVSAAMEDQATAMIAAFDASRALERSQDELNDVQATAKEKAAALTAAQHKYGASSKQARAAAEDLSDANRDLTDKLIDTARKTGDLAEKNYKGADAEEKARRGVDAQRTALEKMAKHAVPSVRREIERYIKTLGRIPATKRTSIVADFVQRGRERSGRGVPKGATGGIVTRPTFALIGEDGPEAVVPLSGTPGSSPLSRMRAASRGFAAAGGATSVNVTVNVAGVVGTTKMELQNELVRAVEKVIRMGRAS